MVNLAAAPVENSIFNLSVATRAVFTLQLGKEAMAYPVQNVEVNTGTSCRPQRGCAVSTGALVTAEELVAGMALLYLHCLTFSCCVNCTICTSSSYS